jgi:hypothetical protein
LQLLSNGEILKEIETDNDSTTIELNIPAEQSRWIVARCSRSDHWNAIWQPDIAHTSAVYIHVDNNPVFRETAAREWISRMRMHIRDIQTRGLFGNDYQRQEAISYVEESIRRYERLINRRTHESKAPLSLSEHADTLLMLAPFASSKSHDLPAMRSLMLATDIEELQKASEPFVLCKVHIDTDSHIQVKPCLKVKGLPANRSHRFLVEIHNEGRLQNQLKVQLADKRVESPISGFEVGIVENIFSTAKLNGQEFEWKLIELRWTEGGNYDLEASTGDIPANPESRFTVSVP